jgi:hypothetical protein
MNNLWLGYKNPPVRKKLAKRYSLHRRYLSTSLAEQKEAEKIAPIIQALNEEYLDCSDSDDAEDIQEQIDTLNAFFIDKVFEKENDPEMQPVIRKSNFSIDDIVGDPREHWRFRTKDHLRRVLNCLQIPERCGPLSNGSYLNGEALFLFYLRRISATKETLNSLSREHHFGEDYSVWSRGFNWMARWLQSRWGYKLYNNMDYWSSWLPMFSEKIRVLANKVSQGFPNLPTPLPVLNLLANNFSPAAFIDCNGIHTSRVGSGPIVVNGENRRRHQAQLIQQAYYNGWCRAHGVKFESLDGPNGMTLNIYGPASIRHNDLFMVGRSGINDEMSRIQLGDPLQKVMYGDSIYVWMSHLRSRHGPGSTPLQLAEDRAMSSAREAVEHNFGEADQLFPYISHHKNLKILSGQPIGAIYFTKMLFRNLYVCLYGNKTSERFDCPYPSMEHYMGE